MKRPLKGKVVTEAVDKGERVTDAGIIVLDDDGKDIGVRPRWFKVLQTHPEEEEDIAAGDYVLVEHGRWTRKINHDQEDFWIVESKSIMAKSEHLPKSV